MTRGRKKDLSIPASRALAQQRDYRARKAQYVSELEDRCRRAESENVQLRKELEFARAGVPAVRQTLGLETAQATSELMQRLNAASASLARFQQLALTNNQQLLPPPLPAASSTWSLRPASFPAPAEPSPFSPTTTSYYAPYHHQHRPPTENLAEEIHTNTSGGQSSSPSPSFGEECCGGIIDCHDLVEEEEPENDEDRRPIPLVRTSGMRFTSDGTPSSLQDKR